MDHLEIGKRRMAAQHIEGEKFKTPEEVVRWMGAVQAQNYPQALWAIGKRMESGTVPTVEKALSEGKIIRTWPMRGTLHFIAPEDSKWLPGLTASRMLASSKGRLKELELDETALQRSADIFQAALTGRRYLSRSAMLKLLESAGISAEGQRGYHILWHCAHSGLICFGPPEAKQQTFVLLEEWAPQAKELPREEALHELAKRYFNSHGPATLYDFAWWSGLTMKDARFALESAKLFLASEEMAGGEYWFSEEAASFAASEESGVHMLPAFDEYLLGYKDRSNVLPIEFSGKIMPGKNGIFFPILVEDSQVAGTWKRAISRKKVAVEFDFFSPDHELSAAWRKEAEAFGNFLGMPVDGL